MKLQLGKHPSMNLTNNILISYSDYIIPIATLILGNVLGGTEKFSIVRRCKNTLNNKKIETDFTYLLTKGGPWRLVFSPGDNSMLEKSKKISFTHDGKIKEGKNHNEHSWKVKGKILIIFREDGSEQGKFEWDCDLSTDVIYRKYYNREKNLSKNQRIEKIYINEEKNS